MFQKMIIFCAVVTMLAACSNNEATEKNETTNQDISQQQEKQENQQGKDQVEQPVQPEQNVQGEDKKNIDLSEWTSLPEYSKINEQIDNKDGIHFEKVTDTRDKRILLIIDENGTKLYKSIFIKNTNRLKIINIKDGGQIFNEVLS
ncbi:hypothetical protein ACIQXW_05820 [Lysinibacillus sp. NPDC097162]|uniref:hypothetical protein n=1 Tax=Lysinibacillus sp. NPDC097162 TaxID=3364140 RepID=UPI003811D4C3